MWHPDGYLPSDGEGKSDIKETITECSSCGEDHDDQEGVAVYSEEIRGRTTTRQGTFSFTCPITGEKVETEYEYEDYDVDDSDLDRDDDWY